METKQHFNPFIPQDIEAREYVEFASTINNWIADYWQHPHKYHVYPSVHPGEIKKQLPQSPPLHPEQYDKVLSDFHQIILPGITHWNHPGFMAYFGTTGSLPGVLAETLIAALNVNGMLWRTSPAATELEEVVLDWIRQMLLLPDEFRGVITDTASVSTLVSLAAAREALNIDIRVRGLAGRVDVPLLRMYCSQQAHSSVEKAAIVLGIGQSNVVKISTDNEFRMNADELRHAIERDKQAGFIPFAVVATAGTTATTSVDPLYEIAELCTSEKVWMHVDAAYGGAAALLPEKRKMFAGIEKADSIVFNPHKWMFTQSDCSVLFVRRPSVLKQAFSLIPEYLRTDDGEATNYMEWGIQLGRRFRALKLWFIIRRYGVEGISSMIREHCRLAQLLAQWIDESDEFERIAPVYFSTICFRLHPPQINNESTLERLNQHLITALNATGEYFIAGTTLQGKYILRVAIGNARTSEQHIRRLWDLLKQLSAKILKDRQ